MSNGMSSSPGCLGEREPVASRRMTFECYWVTCCVAKTGIPSRDRSERLGRWNRVLRHLHRRCAAGVRQQLADVLREADLEELLLDSTAIKAHPSASGFRKLPSRERSGGPASMPWPLPRRTEDQTSRGRRSAGGGSCGCS